MFIVSNGPNFKKGVNMRISTRISAIFGNLPFNSVLRPFDPWSSPLCTCPPKYSLHPYTGCSHRCLYCYATSYIKTRRSIPKKNLLVNLRSSLRKANPSLPINLSTSSDPYPPEERNLGLTRDVLKVIKESGFKVLITTKSDLVVRDMDILLTMPSAVTITITTLRDEISKIIEPNAPKPIHRLNAVSKLINEKIPVGVRIDPIIPYVNSDERDLRELISDLANIGVKFIVTSTYKAKPDNFKRLLNVYPELSSRLKELYGEGLFFHSYRYLKPDKRKKFLKPVIEFARKYGILTATCREGLTTPQWFNAKSCDGTHLISKLK